MRDTRYEVLPSPLEDGTAAVAVAVTDACFPAAAATARLLFNRFSMLNTGNQCLILVYTSGYIRISVAEQCFGAISIFRFQLVLGFLCRPSTTLLV